MAPGCVRPCMGRVQNLFHGHGTFVWPDGRRYQGQFVNGTMEVWPATSESGGVCDVSEVRAVAICG